MRPMTDISTESPTGASAHGVTPEPRGVGSATLNLAQARQRKPGPGVPSPCVSICELDEHSRSCKGCLRSLQEIAAWGAMTDGEKLAVWARIEARQTGAAV